MPARDHITVEIEKQIPWLVRVYDKEKSSIHTQYLTFLEAKGRDAIYLEDDIELCDNFMERAEKAIEELGRDKIINFFSMRGKDIEVGTRLEPARSFLMTQAVYIPWSVSLWCAEMFSSWQYAVLNPNTKDCDVYIREYMIQNKLNYRIYVPNLVNHRQTVSMIDSRRSKFRQSKTFTK